MKKIGILDSGIGGFSILKDLIDSNLDAEYFYISDNDNVPYGEKTQDFIINRLRLMVKSLIGKSVDAIIIACNTATVETINQLRAEFDIKFVGIEPYINYLNHSESKRLALILTNSTFKSKRFSYLKQTHDPEGKVEIYPLKSLALIIERLLTNTFESIRADVDSELDKIDFTKYDNLILGCTHYPLIKNYIETKYNIKTIDPNKSVIKHLCKELSLKEGPHNDIFAIDLNIQDRWIQSNIKDFKIFF
jgi:glutamate racemase